MISEYMSLPDCRARLVSIYGPDAVASLTTLKRRSAAGDFDSAKSGDRRPKFHVRRLAKILRLRDPGAASSHGEIETRSPIEPTTAIPLDPASIDLLAKAVIGRLLETCPELLELPKLTGAVQALEATRRSLMVKYDSLAGSQSALIEELKRKAPAHGSGGDLLEAARAAQRMTTIERHLAEILERLSKMGGA